MSFLMIPNANQSAVGNNYRGSAMRPYGLNDINMNLCKMNLNPKYFLSGKSTKTNQRRPFSACDDAKLMQIINSMELVNWDTVANQMGDRTSRQCRERWVNYLNPVIRNDPWSEEEDKLLLEKVNEYGKCWTNICSRFFNGRSENDIKNRWYSHLRYRAAENDDGKYAFVTDPERLPFPERKKRNRRKNFPIQNALKVIEQQKKVLNFTSSLGDSSMIDLDGNNNSNIVRSSSCFCINQQQQQQEPLCQTPSMFYITPQPSMEFSSDETSTDFISDIERNIANEINCSDIPDFSSIDDEIDNSSKDTSADKCVPEFVDFWDRFLLDEAVDEFQSFNNAFNEFRFDDQ